MAEEKVTADELDMTDAEPMAKIGMMGWYGYIRLKDGAVLKYGCACLHNTDTAAEKCASRAIKEIERRKEVSP